MKRACFIFVLAFVMSLSVFAAFQKVNTYSGNFSDVKETSWFANDVKTAYELGLMNGKSEGEFNPFGNVTVAEGVAMASRLHFLYNGIDFENWNKTVKDKKFDFDTENDYICFRSEGVVENGCFVLTATEADKNGAYDPGFFLENTLFAARDYDTMVVRMKRERFNNTAEKNEVCEVYFSTINDNKLDEKKAIRHSLEAYNMDDWFEFEVNLSNHELWQDTITRIRFDPANNSGVYYIDSITFSNKCGIIYDKWYDKYVDYALEQGIMEVFTFDSYTRNITRAEMCMLFAAALPEDYYVKINDVNAIPDVEANAEYAETILALYRAGVLLGSDKNGNFNPDADIKRSEISAIINRVAIPENRIRGNLDAEWKDNNNCFELEFDDETTNNPEYDALSAEIINGALVLKAKENTSGKPRFDPKIICNSVNINVNNCTKLRIRMKMEFEGKIENTVMDFFYKPDGASSFSEKYSFHKDFKNYSYIDPFGWYIYEIDLRTSPYWKGKITDFRFDPGNTGGTYIIDYIRFIETDYYNYKTHEELINAGFTVTEIFKDTDFESGFYVRHYEKEADLSYGKFTDYCETDKEPLWQICPWWSKYDLLEYRDESTDKYTIADTKGTKYIRYNPEEKSVTMRLNTTKIFEGKPHISEEYKYWPHLLLEQYKGICPIDKARNSVDKDRVFLEIDVRLTDFKDTINNEGLNRCGYFIYFYLVTDKAPGEKIWFGATVFDSTYSASTTASWGIDKPSNMMIYRTMQSVLYGGIENSFNPEKGVFLPSEEWKSLRLDLTPEIARCLEWANRDNTFGVPVKLEDMYIDGVNIGYEIWGNYDCTIEFKNFNIITYDKAE